MDSLDKDMVMPMLEMEFFPKDRETPAVQEKAAPVSIPEGELLTESQRAQAESFAEKIDLDNAQLVLQYGAGAQKKIADFSENALESVKGKDLGEVGNLLGSLVAELQGFDAEEESKGIFGFFKKKTNQLAVMKARYDKANANVTEVSQALEGQQITLLKDIALMDKMYNLNKTYYRELTMYIYAGKKRLEKALNEELPALVEKATASGLTEDAQAVTDFREKCSRFEKKLHDLELTRMVSMQMAPQIRLVQNNDSMMAEKIQSTLVNTIPLWKSQMVIALGVAHSQQAAKAQREVTDMTNELLKRNAENLKMATVETAKESERGIVDLETLKQTNAALITTLDEVLKIQEDGKTKRRAAEQELGRMENELKQKLLEIRSGKETQ